MSNLETMSKPDVDEMMKNEQTDDFNTMHLKDFANARIEIQQTDIQQNGNNEYQNYKYTRLEDMIVIVEPTLLKYNLVSNFTEVERVAKGQITRENTNQQINIEDEFIKRIGQDQESADLATRLLSKVKDSD